MKNDALVGIDELRTLLRVDETTGDLIWIGARRHGYNGKIAGRRSKSGYLGVGIGNQRIYAHRIVFALSHGHWPTGMVDHIDGDRTNNRPQNLRDVSPQQNLQNTLRPARAGTSSGLRGVGLIKSSGKWKAYIVVDRRMKTLGHFDTKEAAYAAYLAAKAKVHPGWSVRRLDPFEIADRLYAEYRGFPSSRQIGERE
jgi:hypothetical protein